MMMPANFTAVAENEMTYVVGGSIADILAPVLTVDNWKTFNTNMVTIIGNSYVQSYINNTLGVLFGGNYLTNKGDTMIGNLLHNADSKFQGYTKADDFQTVANKSLNNGLQVAGYAAAIYNLATGTVKNNASSNMRF